MSFGIYFLNTIKLIKAVDFLLFISYNPIEECLNLKLLIFEQHDAFMKTSKNFANTAKFTIANVAISSPNQDLFELRILFFFLKRKYNFLLI